MKRPLIDESACTGCGECVGACPVGLFSLENGMATVVKARQAYCGECYYCEHVCPTGAIRLEDDLTSAG